MSNLISSIFNFFGDVVRSLNEIVNFFRSFFDLISTTIQFIPSPFLDITLIFLPILIAAILYKVIKR